MCAVYTVKKRKETIESAAYAYALQQQPQLFLLVNTKKRQEKMCGTKSNV
jgi:hypothetical protein